MERWPLVGPVARVGTQQRFQRERTAIVYKKTLPLSSVTLFDHLLGTLVKGFIEIIEKHGNQSMQVMKVFQYFARYIFNKVL